MVLVLSGAPWLIAHRTMLGINRPYRVTLNGTDCGRVLMGQSQH